MSRPADIFGLGFVLGAANEPGGTAAVYFNLGAKQPAAQCLGGGIRAFLATAGTFRHVGYRYTSLRCPTFTISTTISSSKTL